MFDCVSGLLSTANIHGCILADDMGQVYLVLLLISYDIIAIDCSLFLTYVNEASFVVSSATYSVCLAPTLEVLRLQPWKQVKIQ